MEKPKGEGRSANLRQKHPRRKETLDRWKERTESRGRNFCDALARAGDSSRIINRNQTGQTIARIVRTTARCRFCLVYIFCLFFFLLERTASDNGGKQMLSGDVSAGYSGYWAWKAGPGNKGLRILFRPGRCLPSTPRRHADPSTLLRRLPVAM